jgi:serine/threonine protein kinase
MSLKNRKNQSIENQLVKTAAGNVDKIMLPYLDWRIDPLDLEFIENDPTSSLLRKENCREVIFNGKLYLIYQELDGNGLKKSKVLGSGSFGSVVLGQDPTTSEWIAIKIPHKKNQPTDEEKIKQAKEIQDEVDKLEGSHELVFYDKKNLVVGMKLFQGHELFDSMIDSNTKSQQHVALLQKGVIAKSVLKNMTYLHHDVNRMRENALNTDENYKASPFKEVLFHRDIKPENITIDYRTLTIKYCDYGLADTTYEEDKPKGAKSAVSAQILHKNLMGTPKYIAPEHYKISPALNPNLPADFERPPGFKFAYNQKTETYALGAVLAEIFGMAVDDPENPHRFRFLKYEELPVGSMPLELHGLISKMIDDNPDNRPPPAHAAQRFNQIFHELGKTESINVCVISIDEFLKLSVDDKDLLIKNIIADKMNTVALQASSKTTHKDYYDVVYQLNFANIVNISPFMVRGGSQEAIYTAIKDHYDQRLDTCNTKVFEYDKNFKMVEKQDISPTIASFNFAEKKPKLHHLLKHNTAVIVDNLRHLGSTAFSKISAGVKKANKNFLKKVKKKAYPINDATMSQENDFKDENFKKVDTKVSFPENQQTIHKREKNEASGEIPDHILLMEEYHQMLQQRDQDTRPEISLPQEHQPEYGFMHKQGMFNKEDDINKVVDFINENRAFFSAYYLDKSFLTWVEEHSLYRNELDSLLKTLDPFLKHFETPQNTTAFVHAIFGKAKGDPSLSSGDETKLRAFLREHKDFACALEKHFKNPAIDAWYADHKDKEGERKKRT